MFPSPSAAEKFSVPLTNVGFEAVPVTVNTADPPLTLTVAEAGVIEIPDNPVGAVTVTVAE